MARSTYDNREMQLTDQQLVDAVQGVQLNSDEWGRLCLIAAALAGLPTARGTTLSAWLREAATGEVAVAATVEPTGGCACSYCTDPAVGSDEDGEPTCGDVKTCAPRVA